jgi:hypothetical protein
VVCNSSSEVVGNWRSVFCLSEVASVFLASGLAGRVSFLTEYHSLGSQVQYFGQFEVSEGHNIVYLMVLVLQWVSHPA